MKRRDILKKLRAAGLIIEEGANHTKVLDTNGKYISAVPRHNEIKDALADRISEQTGVKLREEKR